MLLQVFLIYTNGLKRTSIGLLSFYGLKKRFKVPCAKTSGSHALNDFEKYAEYLDNSRKMKEKLSRIDPKHYSEQIDFGSVVETSENYYFISAALGKITLDEGSTVYAISTDAPIYQEMKGKKAGEKFSFNGKDHEIKGVH